jgi:methylated-DNA-[protein]-cysteine S-methyltransferase
MILSTATLSTPIGRVWIAATETGISALGIGERAERVLGAQLRRRFGDLEWREAKDPHGAVTCLSRYFARARPLDGVPLDLGGTPFQARVWRLLTEIPMGATVSYAELAARAGAPQAFRAVARANATNPVSLFVPCHRVIGADGALRGYGWGPPRKEWLLAHESGTTLAFAGMGEEARAL